MIKIIKHSAQLLFGIDPRRFTALVLLSLINSLLPFAGIYLTALIFAKAIELLAAQTDLIQDAKALISQIALLALVNVVVSLLSKMQELEKQKFQFVCRAEIQKKILNKAASLSLTYFETIQPYSEIQRLSNEASFHPIEVINKLFVVISAGFGLVAATAITYSWHPWLVLVLLIVPLLYYRVSLRVSRSAHFTSRAKEKSEIRAMTYANVMLGEYFAKEIKVFNLKEFFLPRFEQATAEGIALEEKHRQVRRIWEGGLGSLLTLERPAIFGYAIFCLLQRTITVTQFGLYTQSIVSLQNGIHSIVSALAEINQHEYFISSLEKFLGTREGRALQNDSFVKLPSADSEVPEIEFKDVYFTYPGKNEAVLRGVSFQLFKGETISIAGKNGSGKSTIAKLLAGLYHPGRGDVLIRGKSTRELSPDELHSKVSMLLQDYAVYHLSVSQNIGIGDVMRYDDREAIKSSAGSLGLEPFIDSLPNQYDTMIGRFIEVGHSLSGGQEQLVALARSLYKQAPILILDEPTAALDAQNSLLFFDKVLNPAACSLRTTVLISHTFKAISRCDRIFYLEDGRIVEEGSHDHLVSSRGRYAEDYALNVLERA